MESVPIIAVISEISISKLAESLSLLPTSIFLDVLRATLMSIAS